MTNIQIGLTFLILPIIMLVIFIFHDPFDGGEV